MIDILIIGGGPAGLTAAIYAARAGKTVTVCERESMGGQITQAHQVDNYPGLSGISGMELGDKLCAQAMEAGAKIEFTNVLSIRSGFQVETEDGTLEAKAVIFAGGAKPRPLGLDRETELTGQGISYCALCDGAFFRNQDVAVVGGGNTAFSDALVLADVCKSVTIIHRRDTFRAELPVIEAVKQRQNIRILTPYTVKTLLGEAQLEGITLNDGQTLAVNGLFAALGRVPDTELIRHLAELDEGGFVLSGENCTTGTPGLFVAGDCRKKDIRQLTTAMADGTIAAMGAVEFLK